MPDAQGYDARVTRTTHAYGCKPRLLSFPQQTARLLRVLFIAGFDAEDVAMVTAALTKFKDRVVRDNWVDQAKELQTERDGS